MLRGKRNIACRAIRRQLCILPARTGCLQASSNLSDVQKEIVEPRIVRDAVAIAWGRLVIARHRLFIARRMFRVSAKACRDPCRLLKWKQGTAGSRRRAFLLSPFAKARFRLVIGRSSPLYQRIVTRFDSQIIFSSGACGRSGTFGKNVMTIKMVVVPLETQYLQDEAKRLGVTRTKLVRVMMQKIIRDELVPTLLNDGDPELNEPKKPNYRRFPERHKKLSSVRARG
jgi:hypothetical protein